MPDFFAGAACAFAAEVEVEFVELFEVAFVALLEVATAALLCELAAGVFLEASEEDCGGVAEGCEDCSFAGAAEENATAKDSISAKREKAAMRFFMVKEPPSGQAVAGTLAGNGGKFKRRDFQVA